MWTPLQSCPVNSLKIVSILRSASARDVLSFRHQARPVHPTAEVVADLTTVIVLAYRII